MTSNKNIAAGKNSVAILRKEQIMLTTDDAFSYREIIFTQPVDIVKAGIKISFQRENGIPRVFFSIFDPINYRGTQVSRMANGCAICDLWVTSADSAPGCIPGKILPGDWRLLLDIRQVEKDAILDIEMYIENGIEEAPGKIDPFFDQRIINDKPDWYKGEMHTHSTKSDGTLPVNDLIQFADRKGLDFLAISDHFTASQWWRMGSVDLPDIALLNAMEVTAMNGHANLHGLKKWVNPFVGWDNRNINDIADAVHEQDGLFCVNHALLSSILGWRMFDMDWGKVDLMEVSHSMVCPNNPAQISLWDGMLRAGHRIIGISGTDLHDPLKDVEQIGRTITYVYADELSAPGILAGLKAGHVYISKGPEMNFHIENEPGDTAIIGDTIASDRKPIKLSVQIKSDIPLRVIFIREGFFLHTAIYDPDMHHSNVIEHSVSRPGKGFFRIELHAIKDDPIYKEVEWRDNWTLQALTNPIWVV